MIGLRNLLGGAQSTVSVVAFLGLLLGCTIAGLVLLLQARRPARAAWTLSGLAAVAALALTLWPDSGRSAAGCSIDVSWTAPTDVQSLADVALLLPAACFATIASRRPAAVLTAGSGFSAAIELTRDLVPALATPAPRRTGR